MKKILVMITFMISLFILNSNVYAESSSATLSENGTYENETLYKELKSNYDKGLQKFNIKDPDWITLYGKSECDSSGCVYTYADKSTNFKDVLAKSITCTNGEKNINYQSVAQNKTEFKGADGNKLNGTAYWSEDYYVTCTTSTTGNTVVNLKNDASSGSSGSSGSNGSSSSNPSSGSSSSDNYQSSTTTNNPEQGIETYYIVLGITVIISYIFMLIVKKYNLFKKI